MSDGENRKLALVATLPKSGTWYSHTFFWCYEQLLKNSDAYLAGNFELDLAGALKNRTIPHETTHSDTLQIDKMYICHAICPGYDELNNAYRERWQALHFPIAGYNWGEAYLRDRNEWEMLSPQVNPDVKIVYLYRNPLDHFVSYFRHAQGHRDEDQRIKTLKDGTRVAINSLHDHIFYFGSLSAFIKHYYTYLAMRTHYPNNILMVAYEDLTSSPESTFYKILSFLGAEPNNSTQDTLFKAALSACSKESLMRIEEEHNICLANDLVNGDKHIRGGEIGKWREHFSQNELEAIELALNAFDISLRDFILERNKSSVDSLPWLAGFNSKKHLSEFFVNQLDGLGSTASWSLEMSNKEELSLETGNKEELTKQVEDLQLQLSEMSSHTLSLLSSKSWRLTSPLRFAANFYRKMLKVHA